MKYVLLKHKNEIKYKTIEVDQSFFEKPNYNIKVLGIGQKAIKYSKNDGEPEFAFYDSPQGFRIGKIIIKSFDNELWNEEIRANIKAQKELCKKTNFPMFAPDDGFCWSCHKQIFTNKNTWRAHNEPMTGCPECSRSYCD